MHTPGTPAPARAATAEGQAQGVAQVVPIPASVLRQANRRAMHLLPSLQRQFGGVPLPLRGHHYDALATLVAKLDTENNPAKVAATAFLNDLVDAGGCWCRRRPGWRQPGWRRSFVAGPLSLFWSPADPEADRQSFVWAEL